MRFSMRENRAKAIRFVEHLPWNRFSCTAKVSVVSVAMVLGLASCSLDYTVGYVYMTTNKSNPGVIDQYAIDFDSGALSQIGSPVAAGNDPVTLVASPSGLFVYVINQGDSTVQEFAVQGDGTLASQHVYPTGGSHPTAVAIDPQSAFLYVTNSYAAGASTGTGVVSIFPVNADNSLGTPLTPQPVGIKPVGVTVSYFNHFVYVVEQQTSTSGLILGFSQNTTTGALTPVPGTTITGPTGNSVVTGYAAGVVPSAIAEEPTSRFIYVTDEAANQLIGYTVLASGGLLPMVNGPFSTGLFPVDLTIDPTGKLIYVVNFNGSTLQGYMIDGGTGTVSGAVGSFATGTGTGPTCVAIDPALGYFLYTSNSLDNTVSGERLNPSTGGLQGVQNTPFNSSEQPTCLTIVPSGPHASQAVIP
jgi:6-phosphogluconolactonase (cycloisomerase 2 family)